MQKHKRFLHQYLKAKEIVMKIPSVSIEQMRQVDISASEEFGLAILMMMENASINSAKLAKSMLGGDLVNKKIVVLSHKGNNGGDGLGTARHLLNHGASVEVYLTCSPLKLTMEGLRQYWILRNYGVFTKEFDSDNSIDLKQSLDEADLVIDSLLGYNLRGDPKEPIATVIDLVNQANLPVLSIDVPSGLNADSGEASRITIKASKTLTLALPKKGLLVPQVHKYVGELWLADLSIPTALYKQLNISVPKDLFQDDSIIKITS